MKLSEMTPDQKNARIHMHRLSFPNMAAMREDKDAVSDMPECPWCHSAEDVRPGSGGWMICLRDECGVFTPTNPMITTPESKFAEIEALKQTVERLTEALQCLHDEQNGAPLCRREAQWERAMKLAKEALK